MQNTHVSAHLSREFSLLLGALFDIPFVIGYQSIIVPSVAFFYYKLFDSAEYQERFPQTFAEAMISFLSTLQRLADQIE
ncbi:unnamed protein product [Dibothriocephalus latus]|uniref:Uncharacterized protein n=1 Tax=Dibothriocephalus latus TaxID=60516 RepID=A0A3P7QW86_DIBLA|nr:unnamed protein product [Dibothriocephalus latus]